MNAFHWRVAIGLLTASAAAAQAAPLGTAFTYQGQLKTGGVPYSGTADLQFTLYDAVTGGAVLGGPVTLTNISVVSGLFTVHLDFGATAPNGVPTFGGDARWILIEVRTPAGSGSFTALSPRQPVTPTPNAIFAAKPWVTSGTAISYTVGKVGIGTTNPISALDIVGSQDALGIMGFQPFLTMFDTSSATPRSRIQGAAGGLNLFPENYLTGLNPTAYLRLDRTGNVGIGLPAPTQKLEVLGNIKLGNSAQYFAAGGEENLRIVRGHVTTAGVVSIGSGFTASRLATGRYEIFFNTPFASAPTVTATPDVAGGSIRVLSMGAVTPGSFYLGTYLRADGSFQDSGFGFTAIGPR